MLGIAADAALVVVTLVTVFNRGGVVAAGLLGAIRMIPAVIAGMLSGTMLERFRGDRFLVALGLIRAACRRPDRVHDHRRPARRWPTTRSR